MLSDVTSAHTPCQAQNKQKPFVASDVPGLRDIVGGYGVLFPHEDYHALAFEIQKLCEDDVYRKEVCRRCYDRAMMFDISLMAKRYMEMYSTQIGH